MNNLPGTFSLRNHFSSSPLFRPKSRSQTPPAGAILFSKEPVFLMPARPSPFALEAAREIGFARRPPHSFRGNHFSSFLPVDIGCLATPADRLRITARFFEEPLFLLPSGRAWGSRKQGHYADRGPPRFFR